MAALRSRGRRCEHRRQRQIRDAITKRHHGADADSDQGALQIDSLSATIRPGERVAIVGRSVARKSTLLRLIARLAEPEKGLNLLDDFDVRQYAPSQLRQALGAA